MSHLPLQLRGYLAAHPLPGEKVIFRTSLHWLFFLWPIVIMLLSISGFFGIAIFAFEGERKAEALGSIGVLAMMFLFLTGLMILVFRLIHYMTSEFVITNRRLVMKEGLIKRTTMELVPSKIDSIAVQQSILGRMLGYGSIRVAVAMESQIFHMIVRPIEFRSHIQAQAAS